MWGCMCTCVCICVYASIHVCAHVYVCVHMLVCLWVPVCMCLRYEGQRSATDVMSQEPPTLFSEAGSFTGTWGSLIRLG